MALDPILECGHARLDATNLVVQHVRNIDAHAPLTP
jgi:hypothetical protein